MLPSISERQAALEARFPRWRPRRLDQMLSAAAEQFPDRPYVITEDRCWTYREIGNWARRIADGLVEAGVRAGEHVALVMANFPEFAAAKYAISRVGAVCVPVNFLYRRDELGYLLRQSGSVALVTMDRWRGLDYLSFLDELAPGWEQRGGGDTLPTLRTVVVHPTGPDAVRPGVTTLDALASDDSAPAPAGSATEPADILYASGTTGEPKGVLLTHEMLLRTAYPSAFSRARPGAGIDSDGLVEYCRQRLARFKVPRHVLSVEAGDIPTTPSGRPRTFLLAERAAALLEAP
jgi:fatty-acyl-CoA synthase